MLPTRDGVGPSCVGLPEGQWATITDFLVQRFPAIPRQTWLQRMAGGEVVDEFGVAVGEERPFQSHIRVYYYRALESEVPIPFEEVILHQDEHLIVVDKPHFLPVTPSGKYLQETALVRLKRKLGLNDLIPINRIDRDTAGLVLFSIQPATRDAYQSLFRNRTVHKTYEAVAPWRGDLSFPLTRESRIVEAGHFMLQHEVDGTPNSVTHISVLETKGTLARYQLTPVTGKRHQLRVHMAALGMPIMGDGLYPALTPEGADYDHPLQLLAQSIEFEDPLTGLPRRFESQRRLTFP
ncbi:MAG TPA: RluA family pseudouridine synthase [Burkholderiaceae bacterium]|nr:RluA family pseudouridine synthase [Burkholderiaceae bacterium]